MENGFISLHRKLLKNPIAQKPAWLALWVHLLMRANWEETTIIWNGSLKRIERGSFVTGRNSMAKESGISASTIEDILKYLESQHQIRQLKNNKYRVITILNYDKYQKSDSKGNNQPTSSRHLADTDNNNNNNNNNKGESTPSEEAKNFFLKGNKHSELLLSFGSYLSSEVLNREFDKFILYWTEPNGTGTKQRWQLQKTFDVRRRLVTWLEKFNSFSAKKETKIL